MGSYPSHLETDVVLRDGSTVHVRPARPADRARLEDYLIGLSDESRRLRFWGQAVDVGNQAREAVEADYVDQLTLLAFAGPDLEEVIGEARYVREGRARAEIAMSVSDPLQGRGLSSILIAHLAEAASGQGIEFFDADVLPENLRMIDVFRRTGFLTSIRAKPGVVEVEFPTRLTEQTIEQYADRERTAAANAGRLLLEARSVAVVGASRDPKTIGGRLLRNLLSPPFTGVVYPVNPSTAAVQGVAAYPSVLDIPDEVDLAFVVVPARHVVEVARQCAAKGVKAIVVISAGFAETGEEGRRLQGELVEVCRSTGMRMVGPNCMGVINTDPAVRLNGTFAQASPPEGGIAFLSQSGALGIAVINMADRLGLGLSSFVSIGNKADVSLNDLLCFWDEDERTEVILLYIESFGDPRRFAQTVRRVGRRKPVVLVKSGRGTAGRRAASSHTGALLGASDATVDALLRQVGVARTDTLEEMFDAAALLVNQPLPGGRNVAILTNAGGLGIQCADTCEARGLRVPELSDATVAELRAFLPPAAGIGNPVDMIASATADDYGRAIRIVGADPDVDALIVIYIPPLEDEAPEVARRMVEAIGALDGRIPVLTCFMSARGLPEALSSPRVSVPSYAFPEQAAIALGHAADHSEWRRRPVGTVLRYPGLREDEAAAVVAGALGRGDGWMEPEEVARLLDCYGIPAARALRVDTPEAAAHAAASFGGPVVLKATGPLHKSDVGGVRLGVPVAEVAAEAAAMAQRIEAHGGRAEGFVVQELVEEGTEMLVGMTADPVFGPVIVCGSGGVTVELIRDVAVRVAPLTDLEAAEMVRSLATFPLLDGFRGTAKRDVLALEDVVLRVSALAMGQPAVAEMDCNPVIVHERGAVVVDARVRLQQPPPRAPFAGRAA